MVQLTPPADAAGACRNWTWRRVFVFTSLIAIAVVGSGYLVAGLRTRAGADEALTAAKQFLLDRKPTEARQRLSELLWFQPDNAEALLITGLCHREEGNLAAAVACFERALDSSSSGDPQLAEAASAELGTTLLRDWQFDRGEAVLVAHLQQYPRSDAVRSTLVAVYRKFRRGEAAVRLLEQRFELIPEDLSVLQDLLEASQTEAASNSIKFLEEVDAFRPNQFSVARALGASHRENGNLDAAETYLRKSLSLQPGDPQSQLMLCELLLHRGNADEAESLLKAELVQANDYQYWLLRSRLAESRNQWQESLQFLDRAVALQPNKQEALSRKGRLMRQLNLNEEAAQLNQRVAQIAEANFELVDLVEQLRRQPPTEERCRRIAQICRTIGRENWAVGWDSLARSIDQLRKLSQAHVRDERIQTFESFYKNRDAF